MFHGHQKLGIKSFQLYFQKGEFQGVESMFQFLFTNKKKRFQGFRVYGLGFKFRVQDLEKSKSQVIDEKRRLDVGCCILQSPINLLYIERGWSYLQRKQVPVIFMFPTGTKPIWISNRLGTAGGISLADFYEPRVLWLALRQGQLAQPTPEVMFLTQYHVRFILRQTLLSLNKRFFKNQHSQLSLLGNMGNAVCFEEQWSDTASTEEKM